MPVEGQDFHDDLVSSSGVEGHFHGKIDITRSGIIKGEAFTPIAPHRSPRQTSRRAWRGHGTGEFPGLDRVIALAWRISIARYVQLVVFTDRRQPPSVAAIPGDIC